MQIRQFFRALFALPYLINELALLQREQNSLMRELIAFHTRRPAQTPYSQASEAHRLRPPQPITPRTDKDVFAVSRNQLREVAKKMEDRLTSPWRAQETVPPPEALVEAQVRNQPLEPFHPSQLQLPTPNLTDQPLPTGSAKTTTSG